MSGSESESGLEQSGQFIRRLESDLQKALEAASGSPTLKGVLESVYPFLHCPPHPSGAKVARLISGALEVGRSINLTAVLSLDTISNDLPIIHRVATETLAPLHPASSILVIADWPWVDAREISQGFAVLTNDPNLVTDATKERFRLARQRAGQLSWSGRVEMIEMPTPNLLGTSPLREEEGLLKVLKRHASRKTYQARQTTRQIGRQAATDYLIRKSIASKLQAMGRSGPLPIVVTVREDPTLIRLYGNIPVFNLDHQRV